MKQFILVIASMLLVFNISSAQDYPKVRYLNADNDKNIRVNLKESLCVSCSDNNFIIDGDESKGYIVLDFSDVNTYGAASKAELIMNVSNAAYSESGHGFGVYINDTKIGNINKVKKNQSFIISLDAGIVSKYKNLELTLKANGKDGLYLLSNNSGFGAVLKLKY